MRADVLALAAGASVAIACGRSASDVATPAPTEPPVAAAPAAPAPTEPPVAPAPAAPAFVPLAPAQFADGDAARARGERPGRGTACMQLGIFDLSDDDPCRQGRFDGSSAPAASLRPPWTSADLFRLRDAGDPAVENACALVVTVDDAAYLVPIWLERCDEREFVRPRATWTVEDVSGAPELVVTLVREDLEREDRAFVVVETATFRSRCRVAPSGVPACTPLQ